MKILVCGGRDFLDYRKVCEVTGLIWEKATGPIVLINGLKHDNRFENLRLADKKQNGQNRGKTKLNTSGYKGVSFRKTTKKWTARIKYNNKYYSLGSFENKEDAAKAYDEAALSYFKEFAKLNFGTSNG